VRSPIFFVAKGQRQLTDGEHAEANPKKGNKKFRARNE
jgi:hypothetical protein